MTKRSSYPEHGPARSELEKAREHVHEEDYANAASDVMVAQRDVDEYAPVDYGSWKERFDSLVEEFYEEIEWVSGSVPNAPSWGSAYPRETDDTALLEIIDELEEILGEMDRLKKDFRERYAATGSPQMTARGLAGPGDIGITEDDVDEDEELTCVGCQRHFLEMGAAYFHLENHPGERIICGRCIFEMDVVEQETVGTDAGSEAAE